MSLLIEGGDILRSVEKRRDGATEENPGDASRASTLLRCNAGCHICLYSRGQRPYWQVVSRKD